MNSGNKNSRWPASAFVAVLLVATSCLLAIGEGKAAPPQAKTTKKKAKSTTHHSAPAKSIKHSSKSGSKSKVRTASSRRRRGLPHSSRARLAMLHLDSSRVEEIQQALIREGAMSGPPTGTWDETTRNAMRQYQSANGFAETGLPDAKSLMKLGLGPHPLPADVAAAAADANNDGQTKIETLEHPNPNK